MNATKTRILLAAALAAVLALSAGCAPAATTSEPAPEPPPIGTIVFDMGHGEIFGAEDTSELGQSLAVSRMQRAGFNVAINRQPLTDAALKDASGLVLAGPMSPLTKDEYVAITSFVQSGGTVLLTIHVPFPVFAVPAHWGLPVEPFVIQSDRPVEGQGDPGVLVADKVVDDALTQGVRGVFVLSGWPVTATGEGAKVVVRTGPGAWLDRNRDRSHGATESADLGVIGVTRLGKGYVVVSGDDAVFANVGIRQADNMLLLDNILKLVAGKRDV